MTDTEDAHQLEGKLSVKANADRIEGGGGLRPRPRCRSGSNSVRRETPHSPSMRQEHEALKKAFEYLESELQDTADEEPPPTTQTTTTTQQQPQPESQQPATPTQVAWAEQLDDKLRSLARRSQEPGASTAKIEDDGDEGIYEYENGKGDGDGEGEGEGDEGGAGDAEGDADSEDWSESTEVELPSARVLCGRCWRRDEPVAADDCVFIHPSGDVYHHEEPNLPVLPFTIGHLNKVSEADCKWFHAQESGNGCGGANVVLKWLNWPWPFSLCPDFVQVAIELLDYCLKAADPGGCGNGSDAGAKLRSDSITSQCWLYGKKKEKEEDKWFGVIVLSLDEAWTKIRHDPNLKTQLPKLTLTFLNFLFNSDWKLSEAVVTLKKVLDDESSKEIDKEQFAVMFCQKLDRWVECYTETQSKLEEDNLLGVIRLMTKLACIFSSEIAEKHFLPRYISFTTHKTYEVRRLCVYKIHEMAYAISESAVETQLLPAFLRLCHDKDSKVRAPCLLGIVALSSKLPMKLRITVLAPVYYRLLDRQNALDNMNLFAAYFPTFCPFITTLAHTPIASLELNQNCDVVLSYLNNSEFGFEMNFSLTSYNKGGIWRFHENNTSCFSTKDSDESPPSKNIEDPFGFNELIQHEEEFKSFQYWREPIDDCFVHPEVIDIMKDKWADNVGSMEDFWNRLNSEDTRKSIAKKPLKSASISVGSPLEIYDEEKSKELSMLVSSKLVKAYLPQQRLRWAMNTTACDSLAIYLPPVAFTIGPKNWHLLKSAFNLLAAHEDWKIRAAISTIIHELALMLSKEQTEEDLLPVFKSIMEDLEPVRIGTLSHMASFLGSLNSSARMTFLTRFPDFLCPDFRLREVLVDQLVPVVSLFSACDILTFILPVVILVLQDKIAAVRQKAINLACELSMQVLSYDSKLCGNVLKKFVEHLAMSTEWRHRQTFANLAAPLCINRAAGMNSLSSTVFPQLFNLCNDKVVNVRIATARTLRDINNTSDLRDVVPTREIRRSLRLLAQVDEDPDVRELSLFEWS